MATLSHAESRRLYSWWWDSHISPKHSKWLQDNLADIDDKVKAMIRLIEEDADSFAQRAEMYYKKRPELMKLVEEFYRAYRALAERYDHSTGALRQAHRTIAEAFPNQIPLELFDECVTPDAGTNTHQMPQGIIHPDGLQVDLLGLLLHDNTMKLNEACSGVTKVTTNEACLKQLDQMFETSEEATGTNFAAGREGKFSEYKLLQKEISRLSKENQDLKKQLTSESARADINENEVQSLKETYSKVKSEKDDSQTRYQESMIRVSCLEDEISRTKQDLKKLNDEMLMESSCLSSAKERTLVLDKANQSLQLELDILKQKIKQQQEELKKKGQDLETLKTSLQDELQRNFKAEMAYQSMEKKHKETKEEMRHLELELKSKLEKLQDMEIELENIREENVSFSEQNLSSALTIMNMQDEIISLMDLKRKLEDEADLHIEEKESLELELYRLKKDRNDLEQKYHLLTDEIQSVNLSVGSLQALIKELRDGNLKLKDTIKKNEDEKNLYLHKLNHMQAVSQKNTALEASLLDANNDLVRLRVKIKELEDFSAHLRCRISVHLAEKAALLSQIEAAAQNMENLSRKNIFLENSLSDMSVELEYLREKLKGAEESCDSLHDEKSAHLSEKITLMSQVESFKQSLQNLVGRYQELEVKCSNIEREKDSSLHHVAELQELLRLEKEEHDILVQSSKSQLNALADQIHLLQEEGRQREENFEMEQHKIINAQVEIFILHRCLCDMKEENLILLFGSQKHKEALSCAEKLILELEQQCLTQEKKIKSLMEHNKKLREWIYLIIKSLKVDLEHATFDETEDELLLQLVFNEIQQLLHTISEAHDEKQHLLLEKSVVVTLLQQFGKYVADLRAEKAALEKESKLKLENLTLLKSKNDEFLEIHELMRKEMHVSNQREEALEVEVDLLFRQLTYIQESHSKLQIEFSKVFEENNLMCKKLYDLREEKVKLEEENTIFLRDVMSLDYLSVMLRSLNSERALSLQLLSNETNYFRGLKIKLEQEISLINGKCSMLEVENTHLKESFAYLKECRRSLSEDQHDVHSARSARRELNLDTVENSSIKKDMELSQANQSLKTAQYMNPELHRNLNDPKLDVDEAKVTREETEKISSLLDVFAVEEIENECLQQENKVLKCELGKLQNNVEELLHDIQWEAINAVVYKEKVLELIHKSENVVTSITVQKKVLQEEMTLRNLTVHELEKKMCVLEGENKGLRADLNAYSLFLGSLWDDIVILEELTISLARRHSTSINQKNEDDEIAACPYTMSCQKRSQDHSAMTPPGLLRLQYFHNKIKVLQEVMMNTGNVLELERLDSSASLETAWKQIELLKSKGIPDNEITKSKYEQIMKDIQLDIVLNSSRYGNDILSHGHRRARGTDEATSEMLELWGTSEEGCSNQKQKSPLIFENSMAHYQIEEVEGKYTSDELVAEKELAVDKLELSRKLEPHLEWNRRVVERLFSDAQRLLLLQSSIQELQSNMEISEKINQPTRSEFNTFKGQLKEAEGTITKLIDVNSKLTKKVEDYSASPDNYAEKKDSVSKRHKQISDRARKVSEKIGRLELEMQKIQYNLLKFEEELPSKRARFVKRRSRVRLREYLYGRRNSRRQNEGSSCGCMRPTGNSD
ncbi:unnamed protein product [Musa acuminata var. zebrina]